MSTAEDWAPPPKSELTLLRLRIKDAGFSPLPVEGKKPIQTEWQKRHSVTGAEIELWEKSFPLASNTGILTKHTPAVDIDIKNEAAARALEELAQERLCNGSKAPVRFGQLPKRALLFKTDAPFSKLRLEFEQPRDPDDSNKKQAIEILCDGQQVVVTGIHPNTGQTYRWHGGEPGEIKREDLPHLAHEEIRDFLEEAKKLLESDFGYEGGVITGGDGPTNGAAGATNRAAEERCTPEADIKRIRAALRVIPNNDVHYDDWIRIGMATWAASSGSTEGFVAWDQWSQKSGKYQAAETSRAWASFHKKPPHSIGAGTLFDLANKTNVAWEPLFGA
jgi:putative DNA primase/helicase